MCAYSWRVPWTAGTGDLKILASQDLGSKGKVEGRPIVFRWRWYYHFPRLPVWALVFALLVVVPSNRNVQAWLILIPLAAVVLGAGMFGRLFFLPPVSQESLIVYAASLAGAWAVVWLLANWLKGRPVPITFTLALMIMLAAIGLFAVFQYGVSSPGDALQFAFPMGIAAFGLAASTALAGWSCRHNYQPRGFAARLALWTLCTAFLGLLVVAVPFLLFMVVVAFSMRDSVLQLMFLLIAVPFLAVALAVFLYLSNLPFVLLAAACPLYRERLLGVLQMSVEDGPRPFASTARDGLCYPAVESPFAAEGRRETDGVAQAAAVES